jgi:hypothetical protein
MKQDSLLITFSVKLTIDSGATVFHTFLICSIAVKSQLNTFIYSEIALHTRIAQQLLGMPQNQ